MIYNLDYNILATRLLPTFLRKEVRLSFIASLLKPIKVLHQDFLTYRVKINRELSYTSQTVMFNKLLNDRFNNGGTGIYIDNTDSVLPSYYDFYVVEGQESDYIYYISETSEPFYDFSILDYNGDYDFIVNVPASLVYDRKELVAVVRKYKLAGKRFIVKEYTNTTSAIVVDNTGS